MGRERGGARRGCGCRRRCCGWRGGSGGSEGHIRRDSGFGSGGQEDRGHQSGARSEGRFGSGRSESFGRRRSEARARRREQGGHGRGQEKTGRSRRESGSQVIAVYRSCSGPAVRNRGAPLKILSSLRTEKSVRFRQVCSRKAGGQACLMSLINSNATFVLRKNKRSKCHRESLKESTSARSRKSSCRRT